jgi:hypothetical protein
MIAAAGILAAIGLAAVLAAPWYSAQIDFAGREVELDINAWQAFDGEDVALLVSQSVVASGALVGLGATIISIGLIVYRLLEQPQEAVAVEATTGWGPYMALGAAAVLGFASLVSRIEERR